LVWRVLEATTSIPALDFSLISPELPVDVRSVLIVRTLEAPSVVISTGPEADIAEVAVKVDPVEVTETEPADEFSVAPVFVIAPEPESEMFPDALMAPVGSTVVPPLIEIAPADAVSVPPPEYPALGYTSMFPAVAV
jgi:hypothetical protein